MSIPEYDLTLLPAIEYPYQNEKEATTKYLGGRAVTGEEYATLNIFMVSNAEALALYTFWKVDCNYGTIPFLAPIPLFGEVYDKTMMTTMVQFIEDITADKIENHWKQGIKVKVLGTISYIVDDLGEYIVDDLGEYIVTDEVSNSNKEIVYNS